jgi:hypothetical protein
MRARGRSPELLGKAEARIIGKSARVGDIFDEKPEIMSLGSLPPQ